MTFTDSVTWVLPAKACTSRRLEQFVHILFTHSPHLGKTSLHLYLYKHLHDFHSFKSNISSITSSIYGDFLCVDLCVRRTNLSNMFPIELLHDNVKSQDIWSIFWATVDGVCLVFQTSTKNILICVTPLPIHVLKCCSVGPWGLAWGLIKLPTKRFSLLAASHSSKA